MMLRSFLTAVLLSVIIISFPLAAQTAENAGTITFSFDQDNSTVPEKNYATAIGGAALVDTVIGGWNRFVLRATWAQVTLDDAVHFYDHQQSWDTDWYWTNFVLHPYQGGLSYMAARGANLSVPESFLVSTAASTVWEYFCETNAPSKNDLIYTPIGGLAFGEMLYRLSLEADQISNLCGYLVNPMRIYTEPMMGRKNRGTTGNIYDLSLKFSLGTIFTYSGYDLNNEYKTDRERYPVFISPEFNVIYNDPYGWDSNTPYSQFELTFGGALGPGSGENNGTNTIMYDIHIFSNGMLFSRAPDWGDNKDTTVGFAFDYDFVWHSFMELSTLAPGFAIKQRIQESTYRQEWQFHLDCVVLGTSDYYYFLHNLIPETDLRREYSYNTGAESVLAWKRISNSGHIIDTGLRLYALYDFPDQLQENAQTGWEFVCMGQLNYELPVSDAIFIGAGNNLYLKKCLYADSSNVFQSVYTGSLYVRLRTSKDRT